MKKVLCKIIGHHYYNKNSGISLYEEIGCKNCKQAFTTDGYGRIVKLTPFWETNHTFIEKYYQKL